MRNFFACNMFYLIFPKSKCKYLYYFSVVHIPLCDFLLAFVNDAFDLFDFLVDLVHLFFHH